MRTQIIRNISVALLAAASVFAQGTHKLTVQIPFGFQVGKSILPAGAYTVDTAAPSVLRLRSGDSKSAVMILTNAVENSNATRQGSGQGRLVFNKYGDNYFLSQVWDPGNISGRELRKTKPELEAAAAQDRGIASIMARK